jgi:hypothetical protein
MQQGVKGVLGMATAHGFEACSWQQAGWVVHSFGSADVQRFGRSHRGSSGGAAACRTAGQGDAGKARERRAASGTVARSPVRVVCNQVEQGFASMRCAKLLLARSGLHPAGAGRPCQGGRARPPVRRALHLVVESLLCLQEGSCAGGGFWQLCQAIGPLLRSSGRKGQAAAASDIPPSSTSFAHL